MKGGRLCNEIAIKIEFFLKLSFMVVQNFVSKLAVWMDDFYNIIKKSWAITLIWLLEAGSFQFGVVKTAAHLGYSRKLGFEYSGFCVWGAPLNLNLQWSYISGIIKVQGGKGAEPSPLLLGSLSFFFFSVSLSSPCLLACTCEGQRRRTC